MKPDNKNNDISFSLLIKYEKRRKIKNSLELACYKKNCNCTWFAYLPQETEKIKCPSCKKTLNVFKALIKARKIKETNQALELLRK